MTVSVDPYLEQHGILQPARELRREKALRRLEELKDLAPTSISRRTWSTWNIAALWIGMSVVISTYMIAGSMIEAGMTWWQAIITVMVAKFTQGGEKLDDVIKWAERELEGTLRV